VREPHRQPTGGRARWVAALLAIGLTPLAGAGSLFEMPEPQIIYQGTAPGAKPGVRVIREARTFEELVEPLDPDFSGEMPDFRKRSLLLVTGRPREDGCRDTVVKSVATRNMRAEVVLEERIPVSGCHCEGAPRPPAAWLIAVSHLVRKAELAVEEVEAPCRAVATGKRPVLLWEASWDHAPGAEIVTSAEDYRKLIQRAGFRGEAAPVDFERNRVVAVTGRPRSNGCRRTRMVEAVVPEPQEAEFTLEETYPAPDQVCTQIFMLPKLFVYRVPASVERVRTVTREKR